MNSPRIRVLCLLIATMAAASAAGAQSVAPLATTVGPPSQRELLVDAEQRVLEAIGSAEYDRAFVIVDRARARGLPPGQYHLLKARVFAAQQNTAAQQQQLEGALHADPTLTEAYMSLAALREARGLWLDAVDLYRQSIEANPAGVQAHLSLALVLIEHERSKNAVEILEQARRAAPTDPQVVAALASVYARVGRMDKARDEYRETARISTGRARRSALVKVAEISLELDDSLEAFAYYRAAVAEGLDIDDAKYAQVAGTADSAAWSLLDAAWEPYARYVARAAEAPEREEVYLGLTNALQEEREITRFVDNLAAPEATRALHALRKLQHGLICETLVNVVSYLDTGDKSLADAASERHADAVLYRGMVEAKTRKLLRRAN